MNFWTLIGNGNGVIFFFTTKQLDGTYYTAEVLGQLNEMAGLANSAPTLANMNGVFENSVDGKSNFYQKIRHFVLPTQDSYDFRRRIFVNESLSEAQSLQYIKAGDILDLIGLDGTVELTALADTNGFLAKVV